MAKFQPENKMLTKKPRHKSEGPPLRHWCIDEMVMAIVRWEISLCNTCILSPWWRLSGWATICVLISVLITTQHILNYHGAHLIRDNHAYMRTRTKEKMMFFARDLKQRIERQIFVFLVFPLEQGQGFLSH